MWNPLSWVMEAAAIMAIALANGGVRNCKFTLYTAQELLVVFQNCDIYYNLICSG